MKLIKIQSQTPKTPYAENWSFIIGHTFNNLDFYNLSSILIEKESYIKRLPLSLDAEGKFNDGGTKLGKNSTTSRFMSFNLLSWDHSEIRKIKNIIRENVIQYNSKLNHPTPDLWIQCWYNVLRFGQKISTHQHSMSVDGYLSGHFDVQCNDTYTAYIIPKFQLGKPEFVKVDNNPGNLTIFPSNIHHFTSRHLSFSPRITIAFDISTKKINQNYIRLN